MRHHRVWAAALLGVAALLLAPATSSAQVSVGVGRFGVNVGTPYYGYYPSYYSPGYYPYNSGYMAPNAYSYYPRNYWYGNTWNNPGTTGGNYNTWNNPGYAWGNYSNWNYPSYAPSSVYSSDYYFNPSSVGSTVNRSDTSGYYSYGSRTPQDPNTTLVQVRLPDPNAEVWIEGAQTQQRGMWREFISPPLNPDTNYTYDVRARWTENGREVERTKTVPVRANNVVTVDFTAANTNNSRIDDIDRGGKTARPSDTKTPPSDTKTPPSDTKTPPSNPARPPDTTRPGDSRPPDRP